MKAALSNGFVIEYRGSKPSVWVWALIEKATNKTLDWGFSKSEANAKETALSSLRYPGPPRMGKFQSGQAYQELLADECKKRGYADAKEWSATAAAKTQEAINAYDLEIVHITEIYE